MSTHLHLQSRDARQRRARRHQLGQAARRAAILVFVIIEEHQRDALAVLLAHERLHQPGARCERLLAIHVQLNASRLLALQ